MGSVESIKTVGTIVRSHESVQPLVLVVSAMGGTTDQLILMGQMAVERREAYSREWIALEKRHRDTFKELMPNGSNAIAQEALDGYLEEILDLCKGIYQLQECSPRTLDRLMSYGELMSSTILFAYLNKHNNMASWVDSRKLIKTDSNFGQATVDYEKTNENIKKYFAQNPIFPAVMPGFIASSLENDITTLGRGGSDYTAALLAAALEASDLEIWTDVSGMCTADPRRVPTARIIPEISYREAMEMCHFGAKVIYPPTLQPVMNQQIPVWVKNTFQPTDVGTRIHSDCTKDGQLSGLSGVEEVALLTLEGSGMIGIPGYSQRLFGALARAEINVVLITQASSEHSICVGVLEYVADRATLCISNEFIQEIFRSQIDPPRIEKGLAVLALVGEGMRKHTGVSGRMFGALGRNGINVRAISQGASERNISAVVEQVDLNKALQVLHEEFFGQSAKTIHLFLVGTGQVGKHLLRQIKDQEITLKESHRLQITVNGLCNRRHMFIRQSGVDVEKCEEYLNQGVRADLREFAESIVELNLPNSVFIDAATGPESAAVYESLLSRSISVVACNKEAAAGPLRQYLRLKSCALEFNTNFLYETNVGAGLPVIGTLSDLVRSGDRIHRILAVLSGTLNFVFNEYCAKETFASVVNRAKIAGYTEPDPRLDLTGYDVQRKLLILAREAGCLAEIEEFTSIPFLPESCLRGSIDDFFEELERNESHFRKLYDEASATGCKLRYVAEWVRRPEAPFFETSSGLQHINQGHDLYNLHGKDNVVIIYTDRYREQPLVVKGAGAGAEVTAAGVFGDVIRAVRK